MKLIVAEDDPLCKKLIVQSLEPVFGKDIVTVENLVDLLSILCPGFDLVWLDLQLLDSNPENTISNIPLLRAKCPDGCLIVVSGYGDLFRNRCIEAGADAFAHKQDLKGFSIEVICKVISNAAARALERGASASRILETISCFVHQACKV